MSIFSLFNSILGRTSLNKLLVCVVHGLVAFAVSAATAADSKCGANLGYTEFGYKVLHEQLNGHPTIAVEFKTREGSTGKNVLVYGSPTLFKILEDGRVAVGSEMDVVIWKNTGSKFEYDNSVRMALRPTYKKMEISSDGRLAAGLFEFDFFGSNTKKGIVVEVTPVGGGPVDRWSSDVEVNISEIISFEITKTGEVTVQIANGKVLRHQTKLLK